MISPVNPLPAAVGVIVALATAGLLLKFAGEPPTTGRYVSIDGLRGYLAFFVFMHHSCIWYFYLHRGYWRHPANDLYTNFGQASVSLFFMITGFLFYGKILDGKRHKIDWRRLFVSRVMRLYPLYLFAISVLLLLVFISSGWALKESFAPLMKGIIKWLGMTIAGQPNLDGTKQTWIMVAGVTWTLVYECSFYLSLPLIALFSFSKPPIWALVLGIIGLFIESLYWHPAKIIAAIFLGGILAAFFARNKFIAEFAKGTMASLIVVLCLGLEATLFKSSYAVIPLILLTVAFVIIASGNNLFGILAHPISRLLGEISYGIYLMQGLVLFIYWKYLVGFGLADKLNVFEYWSMQLICVPILLLLSYVTFRYIEKPSINAVPAINQFLAQQIGFKKDLIGGE